MTDYEKWTASMRQKRDEMKLKLHLASKEAEDEWDGMVDDWDKFLNAAQFDKSTEEVGDAARELGMRMKAAFERMKKAAD